MGPSPSGWRIVASGPALESKIYDVSEWLPSTLRYGRRGWKECEALLLVELDPRLGIDGECQLERRKYIASEKAEFPVSFTELAVQRGPAYTDWVTEDMKAIGKPDIRDR